MRKNGKKVLSLALALILVLGVMPVTAAAADFPPAESAYWTYVKDDQTGVDLLSAPPAGMVFVYFSLTCLNSQQRVPLMADYLEENGIPAYAYVQQDNLSRTESAIFRVGNVSRLTWPAVVICGSDGQTVDFYSNCTLDTLKSALESHGLANGSDTPSGDPNTSSDNTSTLLNDSSMNREAWEVLRLTNQHRMEIGLSPLSSTDAMQMAANQRAQELTVKYDHDRPDGSDCYSVMDDYNIPYSAAAENIAYGFGSSASVMNGWLNSSGHRANIEDSGLVHLGVGFASGFWSQDFAGSDYCSYSGISLSRSSVTGTVGQDLEDILLAANITVRSSCTVHGGSYLPLIAAMCTGYDANSAGAQTVAVALGGRSTSLTINLTAPAYTVTLDPNDGSPSGHTTMTTGKDGRLSDLPIPTRDGYTFNGWYTHTSGGTRVTSSTVFSEDSTIYAQWTPISNGPAYNLPNDITWSLTTLDGRTITNHTYRNKTVMLMFYWGAYCSIASNNVKAVCESDLINDDRVVVIAVAAGRHGSTNQYDANTRENVLYFKSTAASHCDKIIFTYDDDDRGSRLLWDLARKTSPGTSSLEAGTFNVIIDPNNTIRYAWQNDRNVFPDYFAQLGIIASPARTYTVIFEPNGGSASLTTAVTKKDGTLSSLPIPTRSGYTFNGWYTKYSGGTRVTTSTVFSENSTIYAQWTPIYNEKDDTPTVTFTDVPASSWYHDAVYWAVDKKITAGTSATTFTPDRTCTETEILTFLWRAAGQPDSTARLPFTPKAAWAADALTWAYEKGMIGASFNESAPCTRAAAVKFIWQAAGCPATAVANSFTDIPTGAAYTQAVAWAVDRGITAGTSAATFSPDNTCTRAEIVTFLHRAYR